MISTILYIMGQNHAYSRTRGWADPERDAESITNSESHVLPRTVPLCLIWHYWFRLLGLAQILGARHPGPWSRFEPDKDPYLLTLPR